MSNVVILLNNLGKKYRIGRRQEKYKTLRDTLAEIGAAPFRRLGRLVQRKTTKSTLRAEETIWALEGVSCQIKRGEVVGIIGHNGAGKSTLLKILSRITEPTCGFAEIRGRVGSLLEVGTGFHAELTGRENIYLNGAILGMRRAEIGRKFDEIVAFAEIEKFIDTPVKRYSSGMYLRLAFAVAAHLEPEILLVDEVLAVGDASFQKKCLNKMQSVGAQGRTVLFVSHNIPAVTRLCDRIILLDQGRVLDDGPSFRVVRTYLSSGLGTTAAREWPEPAKAPGDSFARLRAVRVRAENGEVADAVDIRRPICVEMEYDILESGHALVGDFRLYNEEGVCLFCTFENESGGAQPRRAGRYVSSVWIPGNFFAEGTVLVTAAAANRKLRTIHFHEAQAIGFQVIDSLDGDSARGDFTGRMPGLVRPLLKWSTREATPNQWADDKALVVQSAEK